jgi:hypothetical protein
MRTRTPPSAEVVTTVVTALPARRAEPDAAPDEPTLLGDVVAATEAKAKRARARAAATAKVKAKAEARAKRARARAAAKAKVALRAMKAEARAKAAARKQRARKICYCGSRSCGIGPFTKTVPG